jgi:hypothetical protein
MRGQQRRVAAAGRVTQHGDEYSSPTMRRAQRMRDTAHSGWSP